LLQSFLILQPCFGIGTLRAYSSDARITVSKIRNPQEFAVQRLAAYDFGPSGIQFNRPVTITIPYAVPASQGSVTPYWFNSLTGALSRQGITEINDIVISPTLHALSFKTTHFTPFYVVEGTAGGTGGGGGGGGCSVSATGNGSIVEFLLPYMALAAAMMILKLHDTRERSQTIKKAADGGYPERPCNPILDTTFLRAPPHDRDRDAWSPLPPLPQGFLPAQPQVFHRHTRQKTPCKTRGYSASVFTTGLLVAFCR
jgi:hypothetical protein